jgi:hypothetical protein
LAGRDELGGGWEGFMKKRKEVAMGTGFWIVENCLEWFFELPLSPTPKELEKAAQILDIVSRHAMAFFKEIPPTQEEKEAFLLLKRAVRSQRAQLLLDDIL